MSERNSLSLDQQPHAQLGCGALILIALIVLFLGRADTETLEQEVERLSNDLQSVRNDLQTAATQRRELSEQLRSANDKLDTLTARSPD
ncbi:MAG: hypothetical protein ACF8SC_01340 [Phycisphaerales bacterium JB037]